MPTLLPRSAPRWFTDPIVDWLARAGVTPNMLTVAGVAGNVVAAVLVGRGEFVAAGILVLAASALDMLDGALARATRRATDFGSVFDAVADRVSEAAVLFGLLVYFGEIGRTEDQQLTFVAVVASLLVSYIRARAEIVGVELREDPWEMNKIGAMTNHPPSMLYDVRHQLATEVDFLSGAIAREAQRTGVPAPLHTAVYRLIRAKEESWSFKDENKHVVMENGVAH